MDSRCGSEKEIQGERDRDTERDRTQERERPGERLSESERERERENTEREREQSKERDRDFSGPIMLFQPMCQISRNLSGQTVNQNLEPNPPVKHSL